MNQTTSIRERLWDKDEDVRAMAAEDAGYDDLIDAIAPLCERLPLESSRSMRQTIMTALQRMTHQEVVEQALSLLSNDDVFVRNSAVALLQSRGTAALGGLARYFGNAGADIRKLVLDSLSAIGGDEAERLLARGLEDTDINVQIAAVEYLGERGATRHVPAIAALFESAQDPMLLAAAAAALSVLGGHDSWQAVARRFPTFKQVPAYLVASWLNLLAAFGDRSLEDLMEIAPQLPPTLAGEFADALSALQNRLGVHTMTEAAFGQLRALIESAPDGATQLRLLKWSGTLHLYPAVLTLLIPYLHSNDPFLRHGAVLGLLRTGKPEVLELLEMQRALESDPDVRDSIESGLATYKRLP
jgi:HEAT repeat protein